MTPRKEITMELYWIQLQQYVQQYPMESAGVLFAAIIISGWLVVFRKQ